MLTTPQKMFLQAMLAQPYKTIDQCKEFVCAMRSQLGDEVEIDEDSDSWITEAVQRINHEIIRQDLRIAITHCEVTASKFVTLISLKRNAFQCKHSQEDINYWTQIMQSIVQSSDKSLGRMACLNIAHLLPLEQAERFLEECLRDGYLVVHKTKFCLGPRALNEFVHDLRANYADCVEECEVCSEICCYGKACNNCSKVFHTYCVDPLIKRTKKCPFCRAIWQNFEEDTTQSPPLSSSAAAKRRRKS